MDDKSDELALGNEYTSKTNLISVQHVGVTATIRDLKKALPEGSSAETTDSVAQLFIKTNKNAYNKLLTCDDSESTTVTTPPLSAVSTTEEETPKLLYEMHAEQLKPRKNHKESRRMCNNNAFSRVEFQLYSKSSKRKNAKKNCNKCKQSRPVKKIISASKVEKRLATKTSFLDRLRSSLREMCASKAPILLQTSYPDIQTSFNSAQPPNAPTPPNGIPDQGCIYTFDHGCTEYLRVFDCPPQLLSNVLAERATYYATRFWAEFFGGLHIGVSFIVTFVLQSYRFVLYSLINTLLVGMLQMTSDYLFKPLLTVTFNGFLQPPLIFLFNIFSSFKDLLTPIAEILNNFMKPLATVGRSIRLVQATSTKKIVKEV